MKHQVSSTILSSGTQIPLQGPDLTEASNFQDMKNAISEWSFGLYDLDRQGVDEGVLGRVVRDLVYMK